MTIGVPVAVDPVALLVGALVALAVAAALVLVLVVLLPPLLQAATPAASPMATHAVVRRLDFIQASWGLLCVKGKDLLLVELTRRAAVDDAALAEQVDG